MRFIFLSSFIAAVGYISTVASQPLDVPPPAVARCSSGDVAYTDKIRSDFSCLRVLYCWTVSVGKDQTWILPSYEVKFSSPADGCTSPSSMPRDECLGSFQKILDSCSAGAKISGGSHVWYGPDGACLKFSIEAKKIDVVETDVESHKEINEVDIGEGRYFCDRYMKLFDEARKGCLSTGCDVTKKACDSLTCVTIDGTTNRGLADKYKGYLDEFRAIIAGSCKETPYDNYFCRPDGNCSNNKRVKVQIPSFIGASTSKDGDSFVANYKLTFTGKETPGACELINSLLAAGIGTLPAGSLFNATLPFCT